MLRRSTVALAVGALSAVSAAAAAPQPDGVGLPETAAAISAKMRAHHYNPAVLASPEYAAMELRVKELAAGAQSTAEFVEKFNLLWRSGPFSHVRLQVAEASAEETAARLDRMRVGGGGAVLDWQGGVAILTVSTMMGLDTIEQIDAAYEEIVRRGARALIIDLRKNGGGAFAARPLVAHAISAPLEAGVFVSQRWAAERSGYPSREEAVAVEPWQGWSIVAFWRDAQENRLTRIQFAPVAPTYAGPIYVLVSARTASAAELAADALQASGRAVLIGEKTAGRMLSQKMYDLPGGLQLSLPIADYHSFHSGRIEGAGVKPDVSADPESAMKIALERAGLTLEPPPPAGGPTEAPRL
jgi:C-terminal processing protease CtpA/Prc